jgi:glucose dehydrogenase
LRAFFLVVSLEELAATGGSRLHLVPSLEFLSPITLLLEASFSCLRLSGAHFIKIVVILLYELIHDYVTLCSLAFSWVAAGVPSGLSSPFCVAEKFLLVARI